MSLSVKARKKKDVEKLHKPGLCWRDFRGEVGLSASEGGQGAGKVSLIVMLI